MLASKIDYNRLIQLNQRIKDKVATKAEKNEYMLMLYRNGNISKSQYDKYLTEKNSEQEEIINAALTIGGIILVAYLLNKLFS